MQSSYEKIDTRVDIFTYIIQKKTLNLIFSIKYIQIINNI